MAVTDFKRVERDRFSHAYSGIFLHVAGGLCSVVLAIGAIVWGYNLAVRNVQGIPVIRAAEGPMRVAPEIPGGSIADHQGLSVNAVAAIGIAAPLPEAVTLAPSAAALSSEDVAGLAMLEGPDPDLLTASSGLADPIALAAPDLQADTAAAVEAALFAAMTPEELMAVASTDLLDAAAPMRSAFPRRRPDPSVASAEVSVVEEGQGMVGILTPLVDPADLIVGTPMVQLGTFTSSEATRAELTRIEARFGDLLAGKSVVLQPASSGGETFIRLRLMGFVNEDDARRFCTALLSENTACVATEHR